MRPGKFLKTAATVLLLAGTILPSTSGTIALAEESAKSNSHGDPKSLEFWWPQRLDLSELRKNETMANPLGRDFDYVKEFKSLDLSHRHFTIRP